MSTVFYSPTTHLISIHCIALKILFIHFSGITVELNLWDNYAEQITDWLDAHPTEDQVFIILQYGLFKVFGGMFPLTRLCICRCYFNMYTRLCNSLIPYFH
jgi:hypothetical protein